MAESSDSKRLERKVSRIQDSTAAIHPVHRESFSGSVVSPLFLSTTYETEVGPRDYHDIRYARFANTPTHEELHQVLAQLEGSESALTFSSGMAAISTTLLTCLRPGDQLLVQQGGYGGTQGFFREVLSEWGIESKFFSTLTELAELISPQTRVIYVEAITNPLMQVMDHEAVVHLAKQQQITTVIDNTLATPIHFQPLKWGYDIVLHSATKYLNGHTDVMAGAVMSSRHWIERLRRALGYYGDCLDVEAAYRLRRGLMTLPLRMEQHSRNGLQLAQFFCAQKEVVAVHYPGLPEHSSYPLAQKFLRGFGGLLSVEFQKGTDVERLARRLKYFAYAPSLGGVESLVTIPAKTSHAGLSESELQRMGLSSQLLRLSAGLEDGNDLIRDFQRSINRI